MELLDDANEISMDKVTLITKLMQITFLAYIAIVGWVGHYLGFKELYLKMYAC